MGNLSNPGCASVNVLNLLITHRHRERSHGHRRPNLHEVSYVTFLGIIFGLQSDAAFYYLRLDQYSLSVGMFWFYVRCHT